MIGAQKNVAIKIHFSELLGMAGSVELVDSITQSLIKSSSEKKNHLLILVEQSD